VLTATCRPGFFRIGKCSVSEYEHLHVQCRGCGREWITELQPLPQFMVDRIERLTTA